MNKPKIRSITPLEDYILEATFESNEKRIYDIKPLMDKFPIFTDLKLNNLFSLVHIDCGGYGIAWNDYIDLDSSEIWVNGKIPVSTLP